MERLTGSDELELLDAWETLSDETAAAEEVAAETES